MFRSNVVKSSNFIEKFYFINSAIKSYTLNPKLEFIVHKNKFFYWGLQVQASFLKSSNLFCRP